MVNKLKIDIVSDVVCPWCIIGYKNLIQAINELGVKDQVDIEWQPFELNPDMPIEGEHLQQHSARKYGSTPESSLSFRKEMTKRGNEVGFTFNYFENMKIVNTRDAHILLEYAKEFNLQTELKLRFFSAFFSEKKDISDRQILIKEAASLGLNVDDVIAKLEDSNALKAVINTEVKWQQLGVTSVPTVVINRKAGLAGAQPVEAFKQLIISQLATH